MGKEKVEMFNHFSNSVNTLKTKSHFFFFLQKYCLLGEGNGNPLQCSCLEIARNGGAWWAAIYGVAQSWTRLKRLSSSRNYLLKESFWFLTFWVSCSTSFAIFQLSLEEISISLTDSSQIRSFITVGCVKPVVIQPFSVKT